MQVNLSTSSSKKRRFNNILKTIAFMLILALLIFCAGEILEAMHDKNIEGDKFYPAKRWLDYYEMGKGSIDLLFLGSSHSYKSFDTEIFDESLNTNSFNMAHSSQLLDSSYFILEEVLRSHKPDTVVLEVYFKMMETDHMISQVRYCYDYMEPSEVKKSFWNDVFLLKDKFEYSIKVLRYRKHLIKWMTNSLNKAVGQEISNEFYKQKGFVYSNNVVDKNDLKNNNMFSGYAFNGFSDIQSGYLEKIIKICEEENITLVLVTAPIPIVSLENVENYEVFNEQMSKIADKNQIQYIDYNYIDSINFKDTMFSDHDHLNYCGVKVIDEHLIDYLVNNNIINN